MLRTDSHLWRQVAGCSSLAGVLTWRETVNTPVCAGFVGGGRALRIIVAARYTPEAEKVQHSRVKRAVLHQARII